MADKKPTEIIEELSMPRRIWRWFRSMRTALTLVLILTGASIIGTLIPQKLQNPSGVQGFSQAYPSLSTLFNILNFFDVYNSWWFITIIIMLFTSLTSCIIPRTTSFVKRMRINPATSANEKFITNLKNKAGYSIKLPQSAILERVTEVLNFHRYKVIPIEGKENEIYAEKGKYSDLGNLIFHYMFILLLIGVVYGKTSGFEASVNVIEGQSFAENKFSYSDYFPGIFFKPENHTNFKVKVNDFEVTYQSGSPQPKDFISRIELYDNNKLIKKQDVEVNKKLVYKGVKVYQSSYGWAPKIAVYKNKKEIFNKEQTFFGKPEQSGGEVRADEGFFAQVTFIPDLRQQNGQYYIGSPTPTENATLYVTAYNPDQKQIFDGFVKLKQRKTLSQGYSMSFPGLKQYTGFQVVKDPGIPIVYTAFGLFILGLYMTFYINRRRIWALILPSEGGKTKILLGGLAEKNKGAFDIEFNNISEDVKINIKD